MFFSESIVVDSPTGTYEVVRDGLLDIKVCIWVPGINPPSKGSYTKNRLTGSVFNPTAASMKTFLDGFRSAVGYSKKRGCSPECLLFSEVDRELNGLTTSVEFTYDVMVISVLERPKIHYTSKGILKEQFRGMRPRRKPDNDKVERGVYDTIVDHRLWSDDSSVVNNYTRKVYTNERTSDLVTRRELIFRKKGVYISYAYCGAKQN